MTVAALPPLPRAKDTNQTAQVPYSAMSNDRASPSLPAAVVRLHGVLKALAQCQVLLGMVCIAVGAMADYVSGLKGTLRLLGLHESCGLYFIVTGLVGICGSASYRRGLVVAFLVMCVHAAVIFAPAIVISSSFDIHMYRHDCWAQFDRPLFAQDSRAMIQCGPDWNDGHSHERSMIRLGTDYRIDAGLIAAALVEFFLALFTALVCFRGVSESCGLIDQNILTQIVQITSLKKPRKSLSIESYFGRASSTTSEAALIEP